MVHQVPASDNASASQPMSMCQNMNQNAVTNIASARQPALETTSNTECVSADLMVNQIPARDSATAGQPPLDSTSDPQPTLVDKMNLNSFMTYIAIPKRNRSTRKRKKMTSYDLTRYDHVVFISEMSERKAKGVDGKQRQRKDSHKYGEDGSAKKRMINSKKETCWEGQSPKKRKDWYQD